MSYITIPYRQIQIPPRGDLPAKIVHAPILKTALLHKGNEPFHFDSIVDSGADFCVFPASLGELAGINIPEGRNAFTFGVGGKETLYFHRVKIEVIIKDEPWTFECQAGFSTKMNARGVGFLGREGFFNLFQEVAFNQKVKMFRLKEF